MKRLVLILLLSLFLIGCDGGHSEFRLGVLDVAEGVMMEHPDSALNILSPYQLKDVEGRENRARFALLYSQALDRNDTFLTSDSLISVAVDYYDKRDNAHYKTMSHYYLARIYHHSDDIENTIKHLTIAKECVPEEDCFMQGLICGNLGRMYHMQDSFEESLDIYESALLAFQNSGDTVNYYRILINKSLTLYYLESFDESLEILYKIKEYAISKKDSILVYLASGDIASVLYKQNDYKRAYDELNEFALPYNRGELTPRASPMISSFMLNEGKIDSARFFALSALDNKHLFNDKERIIHLIQLQKIEEADKNLEKALYYANIVSQKKDSISIAEKEISIQELEQHYRNDLLVEKNRTLEVKHQLIGYVIALGAFLLILIIVIIIISKKNALKRKNIEIEAYKGDIIQLESAKIEIQSNYMKLQENHISGDNREDSFYIALEKRLYNVSKLADCAYLYEKNPQKFYQKFTEFSLVSPKDESVFSDLQYVVNKKYYGIIDYLRDNYPKLTMYELNICSMICFGFSANGIRLIYGHSSMNSLYNKRHKIRTKLNISQNTQVETFLKDKIAELSKK